MAVNLKKRSGADLVGSGFSSVGDFSRPRYRYGFRQRSRMRPGRFCAERHDASNFWEDARHTLRPFSNRGASSSGFAGNLDQELSVIGIAKKLDLLDAVGDGS